jgi:molecular chaperone GrpE (heat shock protein)
VEGLLKTKTTMARKTGWQRTKETIAQLTAELKAANDANFNLTNSIEKAIADNALAKSEIEAGKAAIKELQAQYLSKSAELNNYKHKASDALENMYKLLGPIRRLIWDRFHPQYVGGHILQDKIY